MVEIGRSGAGAPSGHSAEPEPCSTVSAVPASVLNAGYDQIPSRSIYERGGWFDGRLGQAYELLDAVRRDHRDATAELRLDLQRACDLTEENDAFLQQLSNSGELA